MKRALVLIVVLGCGSDNKANVDGAVGGNPDGSTVDSPPAMQTIIVSGQATRQGLGAATAEPGVLVNAYRRNDETTPIATATTDANGNFSLTIPTGGVAIDGFLKATKTSLMDTYLYPPYPLTTDFAMAKTIMITPQNFQFLSTLAQGNQMTGEGFVGMLITDAAKMPVLGAKAGCTPAPTAVRVRYNSSGGTPSSTATTTAADGVAFIFNAPVGEDTVSATKTGSTFTSHPVTVRADVLTTTIVVP
jgi:hypothetical protein